MIADLHVHTSEISRCADICGADVIKLYREKTAFDAVVVTNHINSAFFSEKMSPGDWQSKIDWYVDGYKKVKEAGEHAGLTVLFGCELCIDSMGSDYLLYGVTEAFLREYVNLNKMKLSEVSKVCRDAGVLLFQAHPFRDNMKISDPALLDGVEVCNGHKDHNSRNAFAKLWADCYGLLKSAGSDFHHLGNEGRAGIVTSAPLADEKALTDVLKSGDFLILEPTERGY